MITTKRQINRDLDRFGGYGTESARSSRIADFDDIKNTEPPAYDYSSRGSLLMSDVDIDIKSEPEQAKNERPLYTTIADAGTMATELPPVPARPKKESAPRSKDDVLPTLKTRAYASEQEQGVEKQAAAPARRARATLDSRTKILLCVYVAVALALAIAVIATGVSISSASAQADVFASQIAQKQIVIAAQEAELGELRNDEVIRDKAEDMGMVSVPSQPSYSAPATDTVVYPQATPHTNGFDKFCDWLSKVFN